MPQLALSLFISSSAGFVGGWLFYRIWRELLSPGHFREFWVSLPASIRSILMSEEISEVMHHYRAFVVNMFRHGMRNLLVVLVAMIPATLIFFLLDVLFTITPLAATAESSRNPFGSYLNDIHFSFFLFTIFGSAAAVWYRAKMARKP